MAILLENKMCDWSLILKEQVSIVFWVLIENIIILKWLNYEKRSAVSGTCTYFLYVMQGEVMLYSFYWCAVLNLVLDNANLTMNFRFICGWRDCTCIQCIKNQQWLVKIWHLTWFKIEKVIHVIAQYVSTNSEIVVHYLHQVYIYSIVSCTNYIHINMKLHCYSCTEDCRSIVFVWTWFLQNSLSS